MFKYLIIIVNLILMSQSYSNNLYSLNFESIDGKKINFKDFSNKVVLVVNTASRCGFTKQYSGLQSLWDTYKEEGLVIIGVPSNSFKQELANSEDVKDFCEVNFNVNFPMTTIVNVIGDNRHPFYAWLKEEHGITPRWNFHKVLIGKEGKLIDSYSSLTKPLSEKLVKEIKANL